MRWSTGELPHDELPARADLEQALGAQQLQRLPHRRLRDTELVGDARLGEDRADRQIALQDRATDVLVRLIGQISAAAWIFAGNCC